MSLGPFSMSSTFQARLIINLFNTLMIVIAYARLAKDFLDMSLKGDEASTELVNKMKKAAQTVTVYIVTWLVSLGLSFFLLGSIGPFWTLL